MWGGGRVTADPIWAALPSANTPSDWIARGLWRDWEPPTNSVRGESDYSEAFLKIPGVDPRLLDERYVPVPVEFVREPENRHDRFACQAMISGQIVGTSVVSVLRSWRPLWTRRGQTGGPWQA